MNDIYTEWDKQGLDIVLSCQVLLPNESWCQTYKNIFYFDIVSKRF